MHYSGQQSVAETSKKRARILVVDDELGPRESLRMLLKDDYDVILTDCGENGIEKVNEGGIDLVMLDLKMKTMSGIETLEKIRQLAPSLPVVILTGYGTLDTAQKAIRLGACDYLSKPFDVNALSKTVRKIVERRRAESEKEATVERIKAMNRDLESEIKALSSAISDQKSYSAFFHEICNPITAIMGYVQILLLELDAKKELSGNDRERAHRYLRIIENELERCRIMFRSLSGRKKAAPEGNPIPLRQIVEEIFLLLEPQMRKCGIKAESRIDDSVSFPIAKFSELRQGLLNCFINSIHAMPKGGTLRLRASCAPNGKLGIEIADTGCGMDKEVLQKAFEPFFTTKDSHAGSGLGLAISRNIIQKLGGTITLDSVKGKGTRVELFLPEQIFSRGNQKKLS